ncbi:hypothetical protein ACKLNO_04195 [Neisseriaceae bacterium B1]
MFSKPEELIMAILGALWVVATYFLSAYSTQANTKYVLLITGLTALWAVVSFLFWKYDRWMFLWPVLLGLLVACWTPWLDWFALRDVLATGATGDALLVIQKPWYAGWIFKGILIVVPIILGYIFQFRRHRQRRLAGKF